MPYLRTTGAWVPQNNPEHAGDYPRSRDLFASGGCRRDIVADGGILGKPGGGGRVYTWGLRRGGQPSGPEDTVKFPFTICLLAILAIPLPARAVYLRLAADAAGSSCQIADPGPGGVVSVYVLLREASGVTGVSFSAPVPE